MAVACARDLARRERATVGRRDPRGAEARPLHRRHRPARDRQEHARRPADRELRGDGQAGRRARRRPVEPDQRRRRARRPGAHGAAARARGRLRQEPREPRRDGRARRRDAKRRTRARELGLLRRDPDRDGGRRSDRDRDREPRRHRARRHGSRPRRCGAGDQGRRARGGRVRGREHGRPPGSRRDRTPFPARAGQGDARAADGGNGGNRRARAARQARRALRAAPGGRDAHDPARSGERNRRRRCSPRHGSSRARATAPRTGPDRCGTRWDDYSRRQLPHGIARARHDTRGRDRAGRGALAP